MEITKINSLDFETILKVLSSRQITETQKTEFVSKNLYQIEQVMKAQITDDEFKLLMQNRELQKFRPLKNSFTKKGDKILLAKALNIKPSEVSPYLKNIITSVESIDNIDFLSPSTLKMLKTYVYRHGSKDEILFFLDWELKKTKNLLVTLYTTLRYHTGGIADYFIRPIHRMDNKTMIRFFGVVNKHIKQAKENGDISEYEAAKVAKWALVRIYKIQNNSKFINAIKTYRELS